MATQKFLLVLSLLVISRGLMSEGNIAMDEEHSQVNNINDPLYDYQGLDLEDKTVVIKSVIDAPYKESPIPEEPNCPPGYDWYGGEEGPRCVQIVSGGAIVSPELLAELVRDYYRNKAQVKMTVPPNNTTTTPATPANTSIIPSSRSSSNETPTTTTPKIYEPAILPTESGEPVLNEEVPVTSVMVNSAEFQDLHPKSSFPDNDEQISRDSTTVHNYGDTIYDFFASFYSSSEKES